MLEYDRIDISEGIDISKCEETSKKCSLCKFYYNLAIINHNGNHYRVNFAFISKKDAYNLIKNAIIKDKKGTL